MSDTEYLTVMMAKLLYALKRRGTIQDGNWGYPSFNEEIDEMLSSLEDTSAVKSAPKAIRIS